MGRRDINKDFALRIEIEISEEEIDLIAEEDIEEVDHLLRADRKDQALHLQEVEEEAIDDQEVDQALDHTHLRVLEETVMKKNKFKYKIIL